MRDRDDRGRFTSGSETGGRAALGPAVATPSPAAILAGGRSTVDATDMFGLGSAWALAPPPSAQQTWDLARIDDLAFRNYSPEKLVNLLIDLSPEASRGLWDYLRLTNPAWNATAVVPGGDEPLPAAQKAMEAFLAILADRHGSPDQVWTRLLSGMFLRGAIFSELVLDETGRQPLDIATPDPMTARFARMSDPVRGTVWQLVQMQGGAIVVLDRPTVRYVPIDPLPGSPYGRSVVAPALFSSVFLLMVLHDLRRVVAQQGWPRHDITVNVQALKEQMPAGSRSDPKVIKQWVTETVLDVQRAYFALQPDQAFTHTEAVTLGRPTGAVDTGSLGAIDPLMRGLERMISRGIKSMPFLMGLSETTTETQANRQWESWAQSTRSQQRLLAGTISRFLQLSLRAQGIQADVKFAFGEVRGSEEERDARVFGLRLANAKTAYDFGYWSQERSALYATDEPEDQPEPRVKESAPQAAAAAAFEDRMSPETDPESKRPAVSSRSQGGRTRANASRALSDEDKASVAGAWKSLFPGRYEDLLSAELKP